MHTNWTDPNNGIEYEVEFTAVSDVDASGNLIPEISNVDKMIAETGESVDFTKPENMAWFEMHSKSIFDACYQRCEEDD